MSMLDALSRYLMTAGRGVGRAKNMTLGELGPAGLGAAKKGGTAALGKGKELGAEALEHFKANKRAGGTIAGIGAGGGYMGAKLLHDDSQDEDDELDEEDRLRKRLMESYL